MAGAEVWADLKGPGNRVDGRRPQRALAGLAGRHPAVTGAYRPVRIAAGDGCASAVRTAQREAHHRRAGHARPDVGLVGPRAVGRAVLAEDDSATDMADDARHGAGPDVRGAPAVIVPVRTVSGGTPAGDVPASVIDRSAPV